MNLQLLMPLGSPLAAALPRPVAEALADHIGALGCRLAPAARRRVRDNLRQILGEEAGEAHVRGAFRTYARYYLAMMRLAHSAPRRAIGDVRWQGIEELDASLGKGRGALVLSAHLGNWDVAGLALAQRYDGICVFAEALRPAVLFTFYSRVRQRHAVQAVAAGVRSRVPLEVLRGNGVLGLVADRAFGVRRVRVPCGDGALEMPAGGIRLALRAGAAIHSVFAVRVPDGFLVHLGPDLGPTSAGAGDETQRVRRIGTIFAETLCRTVRRHPDQWCLLHRIDPAADGAVASGAA